MNHDSLVFDGCESFLAQAADHAIDMRHAKAEDIGDKFLGQRERIRQFAGQTSSTHRPGLRVHGVICGPIFLPSDRLLSRREGNSDENAADSLR